MDDGAGNTKWYIRNGYQFIQNSVADPDFQPPSGSTSVSYQKPHCPCYGM